MWLGGEFREYGFCHAEEVVRTINLYEETDGGSKTEKVVVEILVNLSENPASLSRFTARATFRGELLPLDVREKNAELARLSAMEQLASMREAEPAPGGGENVAANANQNNVTDSIGCALSDSGEHPVGMAVG